MEETVPAQLCQVRLSRALGQYPAVDTPLLYLSDIVDLYARHVLHGHHALGSQIPVHVRHLIQSHKEEPAGTVLLLFFLSDVKNVQPVR